MISLDRSLLIEGLSDAEKGYLLSQYKETDILILTGENREDDLIEDLSYFTKEPLAFPAWETLPGEDLSPSLDIIGKRCEILSTLLTPSFHIVICPLQAALQKLLPKETLSALYTIWKKGEEVPFSELTSFLEQRGYTRAPLVQDKGTYALRGGIIDLFPVNEKEPLRIEFFGDTIDEIRVFDPLSQKSLRSIESLSFTLANEASLIREEKDLSTLFDYLKKETILVFDDLLALEDKWVTLKKMGSRFSLTMEEFLTEASQRGFRSLYFSNHPVEALSEKSSKEKIGRAAYSQGIPTFISFEMFNTEISTKRWQAPFIPLSEILQEDPFRSLPKVEIHFISKDEREEELLKKRLEIENVHGTFHFEKGHLSSGFLIPEKKLLFFPLTELTKERHVRRTAWRASHSTSLIEYQEIVPGDIVVHFHHGIGRYLKMEHKKNHLGQEEEFLVIEYAEKSSLFVPIGQAHLISRYVSGQEESPSFHTLGAKKWEKTRRHAESSIVGYAQELLKKEAKRKIKGGFAYPQDSSLMEEFERAFPFTETEDQLKAIHDFKKDMHSSLAMDRLICGDVGYGKTEVAMRAAFKAVVDGKKQVAVLVPTTILALQHFESFQQRMKNYPVLIGSLSRFSSAKENKHTLQKLAEGKLDIVIGTHRLLSQDVHFHDLGLLIIDEEQRFGVKAKEHLKALKVGVDCLTLSATPIPRTLYLSLMGIKEVSTIATPPHDRLPIKTLIAEKDPSLIQTALKRELMRDGQVFFIHNRIESLFQVANEVQKYVPSATLAVAHGQMPPDEIEEIFHRFKEGSIDILLTTTIVENGIDVPNANTLIVDRADWFGLADLYQLRGRVGRWNKPAYAYFLVPKGKKLAEVSRKRLQALLEASSHNGSMRVAMRDLEMRGAGDILGTEQSGQIVEIGYELYWKLLKRAIECIRTKGSTPLMETKLIHHFDARLPEDYINESSLRLEIYRRLGDLSTPGEIDLLFKECIDRFGPLPASALWLYHLSRLKSFAGIHQISKIQCETYTVSALKNNALKTFSMPRSKNPKLFEEAMITLLREKFQV